MLAVALASGSLASVPGIAQRAYILSRTNPVATRDEFELAPRLVRLWRDPAIREARDRAAFLWRTAYGVDLPDEAVPAFESAMDEYAFNYLIKSVVSDGNYPRILRNFMPPVRWLGHDLPGARTGGDNPDNCYRMVGIAPDGRYVLRATPVGEPPSSTTFTLMANYGTSKTIQTISAKSARRDDNGSFTILIDGDPPPSGVNHLRSTANVKLLFIRDSLGDWERQTPYSLQIERLNPPAREPLGDDEIIARAADVMADDVPLYYWFERLCAGKPTNQLADPGASGRLGGLVGQAGAQGRLQLDDNSAIIVTLDPAGADYVNFVLQDYLFRTIDYWRIQSSLTNAQLRIDQDGRYRIVVSRADPGVHNWADPGGLRNVLVVTRWQGLPQTPSGRMPKLSSRGVRLTQLRGELPRGTVWVNAQERQAQLAARQRGFARRLEV